MTNALMSTYARLPIGFVRGEGPWLWDAAGTRYLDAVSGIAVCGLGHAHPKLAQAICEQAHSVIHTSNLYQIELQTRVAEKLCSRAGMDAAFFCNSGAEANEAAIKLARRYGRAKDIEHPSIVVMENSFHGRTLATLSASGSRKVQAGYEPLVSGFIRAPYDDLEALASIAETNQDVVAVLVEPIQGEGGINVPSTAYLKALRDLCNKHGWLMMLDEVQTGMGRTGRWFAFEHSDIRPDVMALAKGLGNGVPVGACLARGAAAAVFQPGTHGSTFGGNPLACRAADTVIDIIEAERLSERAGEIGEYLIKGLRDRLTNIEGVKEVRGRGLMIGIQLDRPCRELVLKALENRLLINVTAESVVRLLPPLIIGGPEADIILETVNRLISGFLSKTRKDPA